MSERRLVDYLEHMRQAASDAVSYVANTSREQFLADRRTQQAVVMNLVIIGEAATRVMEGYGGFAARHSRVPWRGMRGMRNRIAHGYFDIDLEVVWSTVRTALPELLEQLPAVIEDAARE